MEITDSNKNTTAENERETNIGIINYTLKQVYVQITHFDQWLNSYITFR